MRAKYKTQVVTGYFQATPFNWATRDDETLRNTKWMFLVLACGHIKQDPWEIYENETATKVRAVLHHTYHSDRPRRVRCYECVSGKRQVAAPKQPPAIVMSPAEMGAVFKASVKASII